MINVIMITHSNGFVMHGYDRVGYLQGDPVLGWTARYHIDGVVVNQIGVTIEKIIENSENCYQIALTSLLNSSLEGEAIDRCFDGGSVIMADVNTMRGVHV